MGGHIYLHEVAANGIQLYSITNSRLYAGLSFPAAAHLLFAFWLGRPLRPLRFAAALIQSAILALAITCREEVLWQAIMVLGGSIIVIAHSLIRRRGPQTRELLATKRRALWVPATMVCTIGFAYGHIALTASPLYEAQMKSHLFWHEVLMGLLTENGPLQAIYSDQTGLYGDRLPYDAVTHDLNQRHDTSSPIAVVQGAQITLDLRKSWRDYDDLCRSLAMRIIIQHPFLSLYSIYIKISDQMTKVFVWHPATAGGANLPAVIIGLAVIVWIAIGGGVVPHGHYVVEGMIVAALIVGCSLAEREYQRVLANYQSLLDEKAKLIVKAPIAGEVVDLADGLRPGLWYPKKAALLAVINPHSVAIDAYVYETDLARVAPGDAASFYPAGELGAQLKGRVDNIDRAAAQTLPEPYLASIYHGPVPVRSTKEGELVPEQAIYHMTITPDLAGPGTPRVVTGVATIAGQPQSLFTRTWRWLRGIVERENGA